MNGMNKCSKGFFLICICLCVLSIPIKGQETGPWLAKADSLFASGNFASAAVAYEKVFYYNAGQNGPDLLLKKSNCYKNTGLYDKALRELERINTRQCTDSLLAVVRYEKILAAYLSAQYPLALREAIKPALLAEKAETRYSIDILHLLCLAHTEKWTEAQILYGKIRAENPQKNLPDNLLDDKRLPKKKNPDKAALWSTFIPGSGQLYGGSFWPGMVSVAIQGGLLVFSGFQFWKGFYFTGFGSGLALWQAFYFGGIENARSITSRNNDKRKQKYIRQLSTVLLP